MELQQHGAAVKRNKRNALVVEGRKPIINDYGLPLSVLPQPHTVRADLSLLVHEEAVDKRVDLLVVDAARRGEDRNRGQKPTVLEDALVDVVRISARVEQIGLDVDRPRDAPLDDGRRRRRLANRCPIVRERRVVELQLATVRPGFTVDTIFDFTQLLADVDKPLRLNLVAVRVLALVPLRRRNLAAVREAPPATFLEVLPPAHVHFVLAVHVPVKQRLGVLLINDVLLVAMVPAGVEWMGGLDRRENERRVSTVTGGTH
jgi:hypothetical protein